MLQNVHVTMATFSYGVRVIALERARASEYMECTLMKLHLVMVAQLM